MTVEFPRALLREKSHSWNLAGVAATPGTAGRSFAPIIRSDGGGWWTCSMQDVSLSGGGSLRDKQRQRLSTLLWRAVRNICDGGINAIVVPRNDALFRPWPAGVAQGTGAILLHDDDTPFGDGTGYYQSVIDIVTGSAAERATSMGIGINYAGELVGGESFSIYHPTMGWRLYEIGTVVYTGPSNATISFLPPLREQVAALTPMEFDRPRCTMRLAQTSSMDLSVVPWTFNQASVEFVETPVT